MLFRIFSHSCRAFFKPSANFGNNLGQSSLRILAYRAFQLNSEWNFTILFHSLSISSLNTFIAARKYTISPKSWGLLLNLEYYWTLIEHYKALFSILAFFLSINNWIIPKNPESYQNKSCWRTVVENFQL